MPGPKLACAPLSKMQMDDSSGAERTRIWIVDDRPLESELARRALDPPHIVETFSDGAAVLEQLSTHRPPIALVLDSGRCQGLLGSRFASILRSGTRRRRLFRFLMLTTNQETRDLTSRGSPAGTDDFLPRSPTTRRSSRLESRR